MYPALLPLMRTPRLPVVDRTDAPANLNGLVRFAERRNPVSGRVPSHFNWPLLCNRIFGVLLLLYCTLLFCVYFACHFYVQIYTAKHRSVKRKKMEEEMKEQKTAGKEMGGKGKKESELERLGRRDKD